MLTTLLVAALLVLLAPDRTVAQIVEVEGRYWFANLDASTRVESDSIPGTRIDLGQDLDVDDANLPEVRLTFSTGLSSKLRFAYLQGNFDGDTTLGQSIQFSGTTFAANTRVDTELDLYYGRIGWTWQFPVVPGIFKIGPLVELKGLVIDATVRSPGTGLRESGLVPMAFPTIGAMLSVTPIAALDIFAEVSGMTFGSYGHVVDAEAGLRFIPIRFLTLSAGYRVFDVRIEHDDDFAKLKLTGPFIGASFRF
jgi:hypothetical protein